MFIYYTGKVSGGMNIALIQVNFVSGSLMRTVLMNVILLSLKRKAGKQERKKQSK